MEIRSETRLYHPIDRVFAAYRDRMPEVAAFVDDVAEIRVLSRQEHDDRVVLHNEWVSDREIPAIASKVLRPEHLRWDDHATWYTADTRCEWRIATRAFTDAVTCHGQTFLEPDGDATRVRLVGELSIALHAVPGVPSFVGKRLAPQIEKFIVSLITPNLEKTNEAIGRFLEADR